MSDGMKRTTSRDRPVSPASSHVSDTSDRSKGHVPDFRKDRRRPVSPALSEDSEASDRSKGHVPDFRNDRGRPVSPAQSQDSEISDRSKGHVPDFSSDPRRPYSTSSDRSKGHVPDFSEEHNRQPIHKEKENSADALEKQISNHQERNHKGKKTTEHVLLSKEPASGHLKSEILTSVSDIFKPKAEKTIRTVLTIGEEGTGKSSLVQELETELSNKSLLGRMKSWLKGKSDVVMFPVKLSKLNTTDPVSLVGLLNSLFDKTKTWKSTDYENPNILLVLEGLNHYTFPLDFKNNVTVTDMQKSAPVDAILTNLIMGNLLPSARIWITSTPSAADRIPENFIDKTTEIRENAKTEIFKHQERVREQYKQEVQRHSTDSELYEIRSEKTPRKIRLSDLFAKSRTVLTKGIPGIGKTFQTKKFRAENVNNKIVFSLNLFEMNQTKTKERTSMESLLCKFFDLKNTKGCYFDEYEMIIILDGLEKCSLPLDFENNPILKDIKAESSMDVLLTNLIQGNLLPSARVWILSQPSGVDKIPPGYIDKVTECQETSERQKELQSHLKKIYKEDKFQEDLNHYNQKNTEHITRTYQAEEEKKICINIIRDLYKAENSDHIRTVLTIGEPGIGKTYLVQKLKHDWANSTPGFLRSLFKTTDDSFIFPLQCSKLPLEKKVSLGEILNNYFKGANKYVIHNYDKLNIVLVLDGLDELDKLPLDFDNNDTVTDVHQRASVDVILTNLIRGNLLHQARIWITSRPAAAARIPDVFIHRKTEIREKPDVVSRRKLKEKLKERFTHVAQGVDRDKASVLLKKIFTDLYIIEGERGEVFQQNDNRLVQQENNKDVRREIPISYRDIFKPSKESPDVTIKTVLTTGVAGIGKTFSSMKYMLDWAESSDKEDTFFTFPFPFRELNLRKDTEHSLEELIYEFFPALKESEIKDYSQYKILIVLDGLDECRLDLNFTQTPRVSDVKQKAAVKDILMNLIQGNLLPNSQIWITSRPAASLCIPADQVHRVTEVRGFNDEQKEEYFRKRFSDEDLAETILKHVKESRSIYIMCHIPVFGWMAAKVLEEFEKQNKDGDELPMPKTLTDLYIHFLLLQCRQANAKFSEEENVEIWSERNKNTVLALGKLAFEELEKGNLLFTEDDLSRYGLDEKAVIFSGLLTQTVQDDSEVNKSRFFSFVHMSLQEFLGAFYAFYAFNNEGRNVFVHSDELSASTFYKTAIDKALESKSGKWDMFLRFLLGLSLETNQQLFQSLLKKSEDNDKTNKETIDYIKVKIDEESSDADENMNLFHCLNELNDRSLVEEVKKYLSSETTDFKNFSASKWSALTFVLLTSEEKLDVFDLKKYLKSEKVLLGMLPVVKVSTTALLSWCDLSELSCDGLSSSVLASPSSNLTELNLSHNDLLDSGLEKLSKGFASLHCKIETLRLSGCQITVKGCSELVKAVRLNKSSQLKEVDLSYNHPGEDGIKMLNDLVDDQNVKLNKVCVEFNGEQRLKPGLKKYVADLTLNTESANQRLVVSEDKRRVKTWEKVKDRVFRTSSDTNCYSLTNGFPNENRCKCSQVFCEQELSALWYWEVEWSGTVGIGVSYKGALTTNVMGRDGKSWCVFCTDDSENKRAFDDKGERKDSLGDSGIIRTHRKKLWFSSKSPKKMAVFLNWEEGSLTYYDLTSGNLNLSEPIHTFHTQFGEPVVPGFWFQHGSVTLCETV